MSSSGVLIRAALPSEVDSFVQWGHDEGWNMSSDHLAYFNSYPEGWLVAQVGDSVVGKLYSAAYPSGMGHIGYIIVDKDRRGKGVGTALLQHILGTYLSTCSLGVGLYSSIEELSFYRNLGFQVVQKVFRMSQNLSSVPRRGINLENNTATHLNLSDCAIRDMMDSETELDSVAQFDALLSGVYRPRFWAQFTTKSHVVVALSMCPTTSGDILGVGTLRPLFKSTRLGPIYAKSAAVAEAILLRLMSQINEGNVTLDAFTDNKEAVQLFQKHGFISTTDAYLLVRSPPFLGKNRNESTSKHPSNINYKNIFSIASLDFN